MLDLSSNPLYHWFHEMLLVSSLQKHSYVKELQMFLAHTSSGKIALDEMFFMSKVSLSSSSAIFPSSS